MSNYGPQQFGAEFLRCGDRTCRRRSFASWWSYSYISICLTWHCAPVLTRVTFVCRCTTDNVGRLVTRLRTGRVTNRGSIPDRTKRPLDSKKVLGGSWTHRSSYSVGYRGLFSWRWSGRGVNLTVYLQHFCRLPLELAGTTLQICSEAQRVIIIIIIIFIIIVVFESNTAVLGCPGGCRLPVRSRCLARKHAVCRG